MKLFATLLLALLAPTLRAAEDLVSLRFDNTPAREVAAQLAKLEGKKLTLELDSTTARRPVRLNLDGLPRDQAIGILRYTLSASAGILIENRPDGSLLAVRGATPAPAGSTARAGGDTLTFELSNVSAEVVARRVASLESKKFESGTDLEAASRTVTAKVENAANPASAAVALRATLREQGGVVLDEQPRGTLRLRVVAPPASLAAANGVPARLPGPPPSPETPVAALALAATPVADVIETLRQISGWDIAAPADVLAAEVKIDFQIRATTAREAAAALRTALIEQAGIVLDDEPGGKLSARFLPRPQPLSQLR